MEPRKTSFIPKKTYLDSTVPRTSSTVSVFSVIGTVIFIIALFLAGGTFFYHKILVDRLEQLNTDLVKEKKAFEPETIEEVIELSKRIESAKSIIDNHVVIHPIFKLLSAKTFKSIQFTDFSYDLTGDENAEVVVDMRGIARNFESIALQSDIFGAEKNFRNPIFDGLMLDRSGNVAFTFRTTLPRTFLSYDTSVGVIDNASLVDNH